MFPLFDLQPFSNAVSAPSAPPEYKVYPFLAKCAATRSMSAIISAGVCREPIPAYCTESPFDKNLETHHMLGRFSFY